MGKLYPHISAVILLLGFARGAALAQVTQEWVARYDGPVHYIDEAVKVLADEQGFVYVAGSSFSDSSNRDYLTIKYDSNSVEQWARFLDGGGDQGDYAYDMAVDAQGNVYVTGKLADLPHFYTSDWGTVKYDAAGNQLWAARNDGPLGYEDVAYSLAVDSAQNVYVVGITDLSAFYETANFTTIKYDADGNIVWNNTFDSPLHDEDRGKDIALDQEGNVCVVGYSFLESGGFGLLTIKYDFAGNQQWLTTYDGEVDISLPLQLALDGDGNIYIATTEFTSGAGDYFAIKYNPEGVQQWTARYSSQLGMSNDALRGLTIDQIGNVYLTGSTAGNDFDDMTTVKFNAVGELQWAMSETPGVGQDVTVDNQGNVYAAGGAGATYGGYRTLKYNSLGEELWEMNYSYSSVNPQMASSIALDLSDNVYVTGQSKTFPTDTDYATIKYSQGVSAAQPQPLPLPSGFTFYPPSPNPFNPATVLSFELPVASFVRLEVFDVSGRLVGARHASPLQGVGFPRSGGSPGESDLQYPAGTHQFRFDGSDLPSGVYLVRLTAGDFSAVGKMVLLK